METYTWNIIYLALDIDISKQITEKDTNNDKGIKYINNSVIQNGLEKFKKAVLDNRNLQNINIHILNFQSDEVSGKAEYFTKKIGTTDLKQEDQIDFNSHNVGDYIDFLKSTKNDGNQKYILIFLAHCFGAGFLPYKTKEANYNKTPIEYATFDVFSILDLNKAIEKAFIKLDCLISLNCQLQTIESNLIFQNSVSHFIGSQQPLYIDTIYYDDLLSDLNTPQSNSGFSLTIEDILIKFIYDCQRRYALDCITTKIIEPFSITLTQPEKAKYVFEELNNLAKCFDIDKEGKLNYVGAKWQAIEDAKYFCMDPSYSELIGIIDAIQFFNLLMQKANDTEIQSVVISLLERINLLIIHAVISGNSLEVHVPIKITENYLYYIPHGIGIYIPKVISSNQRKMSDIYKTFAKDNTKDSVEGSWGKIRTGIEDTLKEKPTLQTS